MTMLGAQLDDLDALSSRLRTTATEIGDTQGSASITSSTVVSEVRTSATNALREITRSMSVLRSAVSASAALAGSTAWNGLNHERFLDAHRDFDGAMASAEEATTEAYADFGAAIDQLSSHIEDYSSSLSRSLEQAREASSSMALAVDRQRANLDQVMNHGLG